MYGILITLFDHSMKVGWVYTRMPSVWYVLVKVEAYLVDHVHLTAH